MITQGTSFELTFIVGNDQTALAVGSGTLPVLATPVLAAKLEECAWKAAAPHLDKGCSTVGTRLDLKHLSPTPVGMAVACRAELLRREGRLFVFSLTASDAAGLIGEGSHERVVIQDERFLAKARQKV